MRGSFWTSFPRPRSRVEASRKCARGRRATNTIGRCRHRLTGTMDPLRLSRLPLSDSAYLRLICEADAPELHALIEANREHLAEWLSWAAAQTFDDTLGFIHGAEAQVAANDGFPYRDRLRGTYRGRDQLYGGQLAKPGYHSRLLARRDAPGQRDDDERSTGCSSTTRSSSGSSTGSRYAPRSRIDSAVRFRNVWTFVRRRLCARLN